MWDSNSYYAASLTWITKGSLYVWGPAVVFWLLAELTKQNAFVLLLIIWYSVISFLAPFLWIGSPLQMYQATSNWSTAWEAAFTKTEIYINGAFIFFFGLWSFIEFRSAQTLAVLYYDEVLQERHEEIVQFGEPTKEEDIPEELTQLAVSF